MLPHMLQRSFKTHSEDEFALIIHDAPNTLEAFAVELNVPPLASRQIQRVKLQLQMQWIIGEK